MMEKTIDEKLKEFEKKHENNWQHLIYNLRRHMAIWNIKHVKNPSGKIKQSYLPVLFNISINGSTASRIGRRSMVIKQTISRTIKELEENRMIVTQTSKKDKRIERLDLTAEGKELVLDTHIGLAKLEEDYKQLVGEHDLQIAVNVLLKIIRYHESLNESDGEDNDEL